MGGPTLPWMSGVKTDFHINTTKIESVGSVVINFLPWKIFRFKGPYIFSTITNIGRFVFQRQSKYQTNITFKTTFDYFIKFDDYTNSADSPLESENCEAARVVFGKQLDENKHKFVQKVAKVCITEILLDNIESILKKNIEEILCKYSVNIVKTL